MKEGPRGGGGSPSHHIEPVSNDKTLHSVFCVCVCVLLVSQPPAGANLLSVGGFECSNQWIASLIAYLFH